MEGKKVRFSKTEDGILKTVHDYAESTTIHGISYIFDVSRRAFDRSLWLIAVGVFLGLAITWSVTTYNQWQDNPVITSLKTTGECDKLVDQQAHSHRLQFPN